MIKYFCDRCNREENELNLNEVRFQTSPRINENPEYQIYELCDSCIKFIKREITNPDKYRNK